MLQFIKKLTAKPQYTLIPEDSSVTDEEVCGSIVAEKSEALDTAPICRRMVSGPRVPCSAEFMIPSPDVFNYNRIQIQGVMVLNVRGCCIYPDFEMTVEDIEQRYPSDKTLEIKNLTVTDPDGQKFALGTLSIRRLRIIRDELGRGIILRFSGLTEGQIDTLNEITTRCEGKQLPEEEKAKVSNTLQNKSAKNDETFDAVDDDDLNDTLGDLLD